MSKMIFALVRGRISLEIRDLGGPYHYRYKVGEADKITEGLFHYYTGARSGARPCVALIHIKAGSQYDAKQCVALRRLRVDAC